MSTRAERALEIAGRLGADGLLAAEPATVTWLSGFEADIESGPSPFALSPLALLTWDQPPILVLSEEDAARASSGWEVVAYTGFTLSPLDVHGAARGALLTAAGGRKLATEPAALSAAMADGLSILDASADLLRARAIKDPDEIERLRAAVALCDIGQAEARRQAQEGLSELELWGRVRGSIEQRAGGRVPLLADLAAGPRTAHTGGPPTARALASGDLVLCDLVPRLHGYWGDSCATFAVTEPSPSARKKQREALGALERGIDALRPGVTAGDLDELMRRGLDYPHHSGHGLGTAWHEEPRIVPGGRTRLEPGMVVALEPGVYDDDEGVRLEQVVLVTEDGCTLLSNHELAL